MNIKSDSSTDISSNLEEIVCTGVLGVQDKDTTMEVLKGETSRETTIKIQFFLY